MGLEAAAEWGDARRVRAAARLAQLARRQRIVSAVDHPAALAKLCDPEYVVTPAIEMISRNLEQVIRGRKRRLMITMGPQQGKSTQCAVWGTLRALQLHPDWRVMLLTYADGLAEDHSRAARGLIQQFGTGVTDALTGSPLPDLLGLSLHPNKATVAKWRINEGDGGMVAAGREATITGLKADFMVIDDVFKGMTEADSVTMRHKIIEWYHSVALTRLSPGASLVIINTRWHPEDLSGFLLEQDAALPPHQREWRYLNFPAISHPGVPDALNRPPGVPLESARGTTLEDFLGYQRKSGSRVWNALHQGNPTPPEGGLFSQAWFDAHRLDVMPDRTRVRIVAVDPSESGQGDEAGVIGAALLYPPSPQANVMVDSEGLPEIHPQVVFTHDRSAQMTSDRWAEAAVQLALDTDASDIFIETYTAGTTYVNVVKSNIRARSEVLTRAGDQAGANRVYRLYNRVHGWRGTGDSVARSGLLRQAMEVGTCVVLGHEMAEFEAQARLWQTGSHQPDRVAAAVIAHDRLVTMLGKVAQIAPPTGPGGGSGRNPWLDRKIS